MTYTTTWATKEEVEKDEYPDFMACEPWCHIERLEYIIVSPPPGTDESSLSPDLRVLMDKNRNEFKWRRGTSNFVVGEFKPVDGQGISTKMTVRKIFEVEKSEDDIDPDKYTPGEKHKTRLQLATLIASVSRGQLKNIYRTNDVLEDVDPNTLQMCVGGYVKLGLVPQKSNPSYAQVDKVIKASISEMSQDVDTSAIVASNALGDNSDGADPFGY